MFKTEFYIEFTTVSSWNNRFGIYCGFYFAVINGHLSDVKAIVVCVCLYTLDWKSRINFELRSQQIYSGFNRPIHNIQHWILHNTPL